MKINFKKLTSTEQIAFIVLTINILDTNFTKATFLDWIQLILYVVVVILLGIKIFEKD